MSKRFGFSAIVVGRFLWVLGGNRTTRHVSVLDTIERSWEHFRFARMDLDLDILHNAHLFEDKVLLLGVRKLDHRIRISNRVYAYDLISRELRVIPTYNRKEGPMLRSHAYTSELCFGASALAVLARPRTESTWTGQVCMLDTGSWTWSTLTTKGRVPHLNKTPSKISCSAGSRMFVHTPQDGRISFIDLEGGGKLVWHRLACTGGPVQRWGVSMCYVGNGRMFLYGGADDEGKRYNEISVIDDLYSANPSVHLVRHIQDGSRTSSYSLTGSPPSARSFPMVVNVYDRLFMLGGAHVDGSDIYVLRAET